MTHVSNSNPQFYHVSGWDSNHEFLLLVWSHGMQPSEDMVQQDPEVLSEPESQDSAAGHERMDLGDVSGDDDDDDVDVVSNGKYCSY